MPWYNFCELTMLDVFYASWICGLVFGISLGIFAVIIVSDISSVPLFRLLGVSH